MFRVAICVALAAIASSTAAASVSHAACPSAAHASALPRWRTGGSLHGATIRYAPNAPVRCGFFLVVGRYAYPIEETVENTQVLGKDWVVKEPTIDAVLDLGTGHDVFVVATWAGAANLFVGLFTVDAGRLVRVTIGGQRELSLYGSLGTGSLYATCNHRGTLTTYVSNGTAKRLAATTYRLRGDRFVRVSARSASGPGSTHQFAGCVVAGAVRP